MTDPNVMVVEDFVVRRQNLAGFAPEFLIELSASLKAHPNVGVTVRYSATGHNL